MMVRVGYLGPRGTYTHEAALLHFQGNSSQNDASTEYVAHETITETFIALLSQSSDLHCICIPLHNSSQGPVVETRDFLSSTQADALEKLAQIQLTIRHSVMRSPAAPSSQAVTHIVSHPQALGQCQLYLQKHFPSTTQQETDSTSAAAQYASTHPEAVAVCSKQAGLEFGLRLVDDCNGVGCQDVGEGNVTTFGIFAKRTI